MGEKSTVSVEPTPEQIRYAGILEKGMYAGLVCLFVTFALYVSGIMTPYIPLSDLPEYWSMRVGHEEGEYLHEAKIPAGWGWLRMLGYGDFLNFVGIAVLAGVSVLCYVAIIPLLVKQKDFIYAALALLEVLILVVAASGIIEVGH